MLIAAVATLAALGGGLASTSPDGLERVATDLGFADRQTDPDADYRIGDSPLARPLAGLVGAGIVAGASALAGRALARRRTT